MLYAENILFTAVMLIYFAALMLFFVFVAVKKDIIAVIGKYLLLTGLLLHTAALICRGIGAERLPMTNQYEFATSFAWALCLVSLVFILKFRFSVEQSQLCV